MTIRFPPKRILVPFDFSARSRAALETAQAYAGRFGSALELFYVEKGPAPADRRRAVLRKLARAGGPSARVEIAEGPAAPVILRHAEYSGADLVVMGTEGREGLRRLRAGSVAEAVVRDCPLPVLTVHERAIETAAVLAPMNFEPYAETGLVAAAQAAARLDATLTVLHVCPRRDDEAMRAARERLGKLVAELPLPGPQPRVAVEHGDPVGTVLELAPAYGLIVLVARRKSLVGDAVLGTTAEQVLRRSPSPVLTIPCAQAEPAPAPLVWPAPAFPPF